MRNWSAKLERVQLNRFKGTTTGRGILYVLCYTIPGSCTLRPLNRVNQKSSTSQFFGDHIRSPKSNLQNFPAYKTMDRSLLNKATSSDAAPTPGYMYKDIIGTNDVVLIDFMRLEIFDDRAVGQ